MDNASLAEFTAITDAASNLLLLPWLPQNDLLGHPAVTAFLSHAGIHSMYEAIYHGVPLVVVPLTADQFDNARWVLLSKGSLQFDVLEIEFFTTQQAISAVIGLSERHTLAQPLILVISISISIILISI